MTPGRCVGHRQTSPGHPRDGRTIFGFKTGKADKNWNRKGAPTQLQSSATLPGSWRRLAATTQSSSSRGRSTLRCRPQKVDWNVIRWLQQNPETKSRRAQMAPWAKKEILFVSERRSVANVVDEKPNRDVWIWDPGRQFTQDSDGETRVPSVDSRLALDHTTRQFTTADVLRNSQRPSQSRISSCSTRSENCSTRSENGSCWWTTRSTVYVTRAFHCGGLGGTSNARFVSTSF